MTAKVALGGKTKMRLILINLVAAGSVAGWPVPALAQSDTAEDSSLPDCPVRFAGRDGKGPYSTEPFECHCSREARSLGGGYAYGSGPYDGISNICMAALHAGMTGKDGGDVRVIPGPGQDSYTGTLANGVFSSDWDSSSQFESFTFEPVSGP